MTLPARLSIVRYRQPGALVYTAPRLLALPCFREPGYRGYHAFPACRDDGVVINSPTRLRALDSYDILDTPAAEGFDDIVVLASQICDTPVALVSFVTSRRQWFKARIGFAPCETPLEQSVCAHALGLDDLLVIPDLTADPRTMHNTLVTGEPHIRFYAGAVLKTPDGEPLGTLCVIDAKPRPAGLTTAQAAGLRALGRQVMAQMALRKALLDANAAQVAAAESERQLRFSLHAARLGLWSLDLGTGRLDASAICRENFGRDPAAAFSHRDLEGALHPNDRARLQSALSATVANGDDIGMECRVVKPDGSDAWVLLRARLVLDQTGQPSRIAGISLDVTERRRAQSQLEKSEERLSLALRASGNIGTWDWDFATGKVYGDAMLAELYGVDPALIARGASLAELQANLVTEEGEDFPADLARAIAQADEAPRERRIRKPDGSIRWLIAQGRMVRDADGMPVRWPGATVDITELKVAQQTQKLLSEELAHRVKNTFAIVQAIASQTLNKAASLTEARETLVARLIALSRAHDILVQESWARANLRTLIESAPHLHGRAEERQITIAGPDLMLGPQAALSFALILHELGTNATKHGALSTEAGHVTVTWREYQADATPRLHFEWRESGGPEVSAPTRKGFGSRLIEHSLPQGLGAEVRLHFAAAGVVLTLDAPLSALATP